MGNESGRDEIPTARIARSPRVGRVEHPAARKRGLGFKFLVAGAILLPSSCLVFFVVIGALVVVNEAAVVGTWVVEVEPGEAVASEFRDMRITFDGDGDTCRVVKEGREWTSRWGAEPYGAGAAGWVNLPDSRGRGAVEKFDIRTAASGRIEVSDPQSPGRRARMRPVER